jgi:hypothetical protein
MRVEDLVADFDAEFVGRFHHDAEKLRGANS